jgi:hypothetical protein
MVGMCRSLGVRRRSQWRLRMMGEVHRRVHVRGMDAREAVDGRVYRGDGEGDVGRRLRAAVVAHRVRPAIVSTTV